MTKPLLGYHVSAAGGVAKAPARAAELGITTFQFFSRPPQGGPAPVITTQDAELFRSECARLGFARCYIHTPYVLNLASDQERVRFSSIEIIRTDLERGTMLGATAAMTHLGSGAKVGREKGVTLVADGIREIMDGYKGTTQLLLEIAAGAGTVMGDTFEEMAEILRLVDDDRVGVCFDTAHAFASGYDLTSKESVRDVARQFDKTIGIKRLKLSHFNDSMVPRGAKKDRHDHIGKGEIGAEGLKEFATGKHFGHLDLILETPDDETTKNDIVLVKKWRQI